MLRPLLSRLVAVSLLIAVGSAADAQLPRPTSRVPGGPNGPGVTGVIDESRVVTLSGNVHPLARPEYDRGEVSPELRLDRMVLVLKPGAAQQAALDGLVEAQQEPGSPLYHEWLSPEEFGERFGPSDRDLAKIIAWLAGHGFAVEPPPAGRQQLIFSGQASQVADAFHTGIHSYLVDGAWHLGNSEDPQIPEVLSPMVAGVLSLHDFRRRSSSRKVREVADPLNTEGGMHHLFPGDLATIYDLTPLYAAGKNGAGASIAIAGRSNIHLRDVTDFRSTAGLTANQPAVVLAGPDPGLVSGDQDESTLDVEWAGALAPNAKVSLVAGASTATTDGVDLAAQYIVNHKTATVMSTSYGSCEADMGSAELAYYNSLWEQAASEGISVFVSAGDSGAAGCSAGSASRGTGNGVNGLCSSPYSTCVGGTEFNEGSGSYWNATNGPGGVSARSYIPEKVWNESASDGGSGLWASGGGRSLVYPQPGWQKGVSGAESNGMRTVPDVALTAAGHDGYLMNENGAWYVVSGTSASSPAFAGIMAEVVGARSGAAQGGVNPRLYGLLNAGLDPFHATLTGNNSVPGVTGFSASGAAYNLATGLGSVDANLLVNAWPGEATAVPGFSLTPSVQSVVLQRGKSTTFTIAIAGSGGFSGNVSLAASVPSGVTLSFSPASAKPGAVVTATLSASANAGAGSAAITITGVSGSFTQSSTIALVIQAPPSLAISLNTGSQSVAQGGSGTLLVTSTTGGGFSGNVTLSVSGLPSGVAATWSSASYTATTDGSRVATLTIRAGTTAALGSTTIRLSAVGGELSASAAATLQVTRPSLLRPVTKPRR